MKRLILLLVLFLFIGIISADIISPVSTGGFYKWTGTQKTPTNDGYASGYDSIISSSFKGAYLSNKVFTVYTVVDSVITTGTNIDHMTPVLQYSMDNVTWVTWQVCEWANSPALAAATKWLIACNTVGLYAPYLRINYVGHTSAHAAVANMNTALAAGDGDITTYIYATKTLE